MRDADPHILQAANLLVDRHGFRAPGHAAMRADALRVIGDTEGHAVWTRVRAVVEELLWSGPQDGERRQRCRA